MTIHDEEEDTFQRPAPSSLSLTSFSFFALLALLQIMSVLFNLCEVLLARAAGWKGSWIFYAPFADRPSSGFYANVPLGSLYELRELIVAAVALAIALLAL